MSEGRNIVENWISNAPDRAGMAEGCPPKHVSFKDRDTLASAIDKAISSKLTQVVKPHERIVAAAVYYLGVTYSVPRPGRHGEVIHLMSNRGLKGEFCREQGFLTSEGRFVDRYLGFSIAWKAKQLLTESGLSPPMLTSEDVW